MWHRGFVGIPPAVARLRWRRTCTQGRGCQTSPDHISNTWRQTGTNTSNIGFNTRQNLTQHAHAADVGSAKWHCRCLASKKLHNRNSKVLQMNNFNANNSKKTYIGGVFVFWICSSFRRINSRSLGYSSKRLLKPATVHTSNWNEIYM